MKGSRAEELKPNEWRKYEQYKSCYDSAKVTTALFTYNK
jgi:hypothetical protein